MKISTRSQKLAGVVSERLPAIVARFFTPAEVGFLTITAIEISGDLQVADIFVRTIGKSTNLVEKLNSARKKISFELAREVKTRRPIEIRFKFDKSVKIAEKIENFSG